MLSDIEIRQLEDLLAKLHGGVVTYMAERDTEDHLNVQLGAIYEKYHFPGAFRLKANELEKLLGLFLSPTNPVNAEAKKRSART